MKSVKDNIDYNKVYHCDMGGEYKIIEYLYYDSKAKDHFIKIKFSDTCTEKIVRYWNAIAGNVKDPYAKIICGVACIGNVAGASKHKKQYDVWRGMIGRCYDSKYFTYGNYGGAGVRVSDRWLCFEYFLNDLPSLSGYNEWINDTKGIYQLDKDTLQEDIPQHMRVYSKETCCFITRSENYIRRSKDKKIYGNPDTQYYGVTKSGNNFRACIVVGGIKRNLGTFYLAEAAAVIYNYYAWLYGNPLINENVNMTVAEALRYKSTYRVDPPVEMCKIV